MLPILFKKNVFLNYSELYILSLKSAKNKLEIKHYFQLLYFVLSFQVNYQELIFYLSKPKLKQKTDLR